MGDALGIDLRVAACAAARWRDGAVEPCPLGDDGAAEVATAELMTDAGGSPTHVVDAVEATRAALAAVAERALRGDAVDAVGVAYALTPDDGPRRLAEQAAAGAFGPAFLVARPVAAVAAAARSPHAAHTREGDVAVLDMDGSDVEISVVRRGRDGDDVLGATRVVAPRADHVDMAAHLNDAVTALESLLAGSVGGNAGVRLVVAVGRSEWLDQLALQVRVATGLDVAVDPDPALAAAMGAAMLAGGSETRGRARIAGSLAAVAPAAMPLAQSLTASGSAAGAGVGTAVGDVLTGSGEAGADIGAALHGGAGARGESGIGDALGEAVGDGLAGKDGSDGVRRLKEPDDGGIGDALGDAVGDGLADSASGAGLAGAAVGAGVRRRRGGTRRRAAIGAAAAAAALLVVVGALAAFGGGSDGGAGADDVETAGGRAATTRSDRGSERDTDEPTTTVAGSPATVPAEGTPGDAVPVGSGSTTTDGGGGTSADPGTPATPGGPAPTTAPGPGDPPATTVPTAPPDTTGPSVTGLARSVSLINEIGGEFCVEPSTSTVSASISDPSGVTSAVVTWSGDGDSGTATMSPSGSSWSAAVGPVADNPNLGYPQTDMITWTVTALDGAGNATSVTGASITVQGC